MIKNPKFTKKIEDFVCGHCHKKIKGTGYTNHCPKCLWSKHVDNNPGDRLNSCQGMMKTVDLELKNGHIYLIQQCQRCKQHKRIKTQENDNFDKILAITKNR
jgi:hypothetical protein